MREGRPPQQSQETDDLTAARFYARIDALTPGMREWLGAAGSADPINREDLGAAASDTVAYLLSRPAGPEDLPPPEEAEGQLAVQAGPQITQNLEPPKDQPRRPLTNPLLVAGAALGTWLSHPEKGRRRQVLATLGVYAVIGTAAWLSGHHPVQESYTALPPEALPPPKPAGPGFTQAFVDQLKPQNYHGQKYEWGAVAAQVGPAEATATVLEMVQDARGQGAQVDTWGSVRSGHWGIGDITVKFADGSHKSYYDTPHKLALLQYLSKLSQPDEDDDDDDLDIN